MQPVTSSHASADSVEVQNKPESINPDRIELQSQQLIDTPTKTRQSDVLTRKAQASGAKDIYSLQDRELAARYCFQCQLRGCLYYPISAFLMPCNSRNWVRQL